MPRLPTAFICHGAGPMPVTRPQLQGTLPTFLRTFGERVKAAAPRAVLVVSAHWEVRKHRHVLCCARRAQLAVGVHAEPGAEGRVITVEGVK